MRNIYLIILIVTFLCFSGCNDIHKSEEVNSRSLTELIEIVPTNEFELIAESEESIEYRLSGKYFNIQKFNIGYRIETDFLIAKLFMEVDNQELGNLLMQGADFKTLEKDGLLKIEFYDKNMNKLNFNDRDKLFSEFENINYVLAGCTAGNVFECVANHCEDAGALLCAGCAVSKYCMAGLIAWCAAEVQFEIENPIHCEQ